MIAEIRRQLIVVILEAVDQLTIGIKNLKMIASAVGLEEPPSEAVTRERLNLIGPTNNRCPNQFREAEIPVSKGVASIERIVSEGAGQKQGRRSEVGLAS